ncbi:hypothetical protein ANTPLA_LOCUS9959 [Anthophora plagiata]
MTINRVSSARGMQTARKQHERDIRSPIHTRDEWKRLGGSLMAKFSIRQTSVRGNGSSFSRRGEPNTPGS